jgi:hypothetical protein
MQTRVKRDSSCLVLMLAPRPIEVLLFYNYAKPQNDEIIFNSSLISMYFEKKTSHFHGYSKMS